jgi:amino acid transporter
MSPFLRNLGILALVAVLIVVLNAETALVTASLLLRVAFFLVIGIVIYFFWRDVGRHEIATWSDRNSRVFYVACALLVVDAGWWIWSAPQGPDALIAIVVAAVCAYVGVRIWREQRRTL